ncbi:hypothetical protein SLEP1_g2887 [Rubroshorea leprosula]|uniref:Uncharacterized protein n=1 Tax=Rubroshorea leprosula TaxID=152421 RepID=A0AAV5HPF5_9ROSI|nr:hypothetical protein SLEP1_g2887 [Rubroshorea leprosula]
MLPPYLTVSDCRRELQGGHGDSTSYQFRNSVLEQGAFAYLKVQQHSRFAVWLFGRVYSLLLGNIITENWFAAGDVNF